MKLQLLGGLTADRFLSEYWQKRPLLVRGAIPGFKGLLTPANLRRMAARDDTESRLVWRERGKWRLERGPLKASRLTAMPERNWTLLVQGINLHSDPGDALLRHFDFIPGARLDDLMVSFAAPQGGVGPHLDSYDVFLLQGEGRRRWRISSQTDRRIIEGAPLAVLARFRHEEEWVLGPGDMLYLPPDYAHEGVALEACMTYSIGFRAPAARQLAHALLDRLDQLIDTASLPPRYADPDIAATRSPGKIPRSMVDYARQVARLLVLSEKQIESALGQYLCEPKSLVVFEQPARAMSRSTFAQQVFASGLRLDRRTLLLHSGRQFFINGEEEPATGTDRPLIRSLSDGRALPPGTRIAGPTHEMLYRWYLYGWLHPGNGRG